MEQETLFESKSVNLSAISNNQKGFTLIELLMVISILGLVLAMSIPNYNLYRERARNAALKSNMHQVSVVIEVFHLEKGYYADDFYEDGFGALFPGGKWDQELGKLPTNPWTGKEMDPDEIDTDEYDDLADIANTSENGPNDDWGYEPGEMRYGVYSPPGRAEATNWGLIGFDRSGQSLRDFSPEHEVIIFVLHN
ncbi:MAG: prepilin-type N-terminal cleavage/methylation domain-containing protein [candidate division WOR-3 bacterium]|nr:prepilin-type N-terminal cleavage/methylation domain-containing protein [candidate division WOR-3 bacterium]MDH5682908.1 prepilin-type N-terminal cleavage/methylation domain-containing protein [candidate division WOR-3 bacterium]